MAHTGKTYSRLTRNAAGLGMYSSLWLGPDHLMIVRSTGYTESYTRVQLADLKGIFLTPSDRRLWWSIPWVMLGAITGIRMIFVMINGETPYVSGPLFLVGVIGVAINHAFGAGCRAYVVTGVQTARMPSLVRRRQAQRVIARLQPLIMAAQARLVPGSVANPAPAAPATLAVESAPVPPVIAPRRPESPVLPPNVPGA